MLVVNSMGEKCNVCRVWLEVNLDESLSFEAFAYGLTRLSPFSSGQFPTLLGAFTDMETGKKVVRELDAALLDECRDSYSLAHRFKIEGETLCRI